MAQRYFCRISRASARRTTIRMLAALCSASLTIPTLQRSVRPCSKALPAAIPQVVVTDPLAALSDFAREWRRQFSIPVIGVTGSNGKTSKPAPEINSTRVRGESRRIAPDVAVGGALLFPHIEKRRQR